MKKSYQKPFMEVIDIQIEQQLLAGSGMVTDVVVEFGEDATVDDVAGSPVFNYGLEVIWNE